MNLSGPSFCTCPIFYICFHILRLFQDDRKRLKTMCNISTCTQLVLYKTEDGWLEKSEFCTFPINSSYYEAYYVHFVAGKRLWQDKIFFECFFLMNIKYNHLIYVLLPFIAQWPESATRRIDYFPIAHNTLCLPPKFCITYCLKMLLGKCNTPRSI